ncbi:PfkB family carbohydrate kinase [Pseudoalteromonas piscicida]|uniref:ADP-heptose synthase n=1 Tax=Pseudoalteromonas piscicida TaxID=43662 RepID=A0A2A5JJJ5_PSEO7|nr:PfkB family carbohydrate kinase [Pseudoalteromonas piscicida]PCK29615.1 ADP-heptose synthase [Pseudoalteromonas piscicida]
MKVDSDKNTKRILVIGNFDVLHPGHIRLLKFAKECGDVLTVAVNADKVMNIKSRVKQEDRLEMVKSLECVDETFLTTESPEALVERLQPYAIVKGREFEEKINPELKALHRYGGKLIFGSGEFEASLEHYVKKTTKLDTNFDFKELLAYASRHCISAKSMREHLDAVKSIRVIVIGELIVDEYVQGTAIGLSQEDPTIVMTPSKKNTFLGGAAITAGHIKSLGASHVSLYSLLGEDEAADYARAKVADYKVSPHFYIDESRPTPLKTRYRASNKTLLRVNQVRQHKISKELQHKIVTDLKKSLKNADLLVFSDFNYGLLPSTLVESLIQLCSEHKVKVVADSQTSSQVGDISRYKNIDLITPTEKEVRVALNNSDDGLVILAQKLTEKSKPSNLVITLAEEGILIHKPNDSFTHWENDRLPALNSNAVDPAGAGDCFLAASSLALAAGADIWHACYLGSLAAACQVASLGNTPLSSTTLEKTLEESFS